MDVRKMTDADLLARTHEARKAAHEAPFAEWSMDHRGHSAIVNHTSAFAARSREWIELANEVDRRGLPQPVLSS
jgi:hypothetical protein